MITNIERIGRFTSSNIWKLTTKDRKGDDFGSAALTYIEEKRAERTLGRSIDLGATSNSLTWGKIMEHYCNKYHLDLNYTLCSDQTDIHPKYNFLSGSKDAVKIDTAVEIKCFEPKMFYKLSMAILKFNEGLISLDYFKNDAELKKIFWQVLSNAAILNKPFCEIVSYTPTEKQLHEIREDIETTNILEKLKIEPWQGRYIVEKDISNLSYIPEGIEFPNFNKMRFETPIHDVIELTKLVIKAENILTNG